MKEPVRVPSFEVPKRPSLLRQQHLLDRLGVHSLRDLHPEAKTSDADANYYPWRVTIPFHEGVPGLIGHSESNRVWFLRAPSPNVACRNALRCWEYFEGPWRPRQIFADFQTAVGLDEPEWAAYWREARKLADRCEVVVISKNVPKTRKLTERAWRTNKPILFRDEQEKHPLIFSCTIFNPDPDDERSPGSDALSKPWSSDEQPEQKEL